MTYRSIPYDELKALTRINLRDFIENAEKMRDDFDKYKGEITIEFSTNGLLLEDKIQLLAKMPCEHGRWNVFWCDTCFDQHGPDGAFHCELISHE